LGGLPILPRSCLPSCSRLNQKIEEIMLNLFSLSRDSICAQERSPEVVIAEAQTVEQKTAYTTLRPPSADYERAKNIFVRFFLCREDYINSA
jgi:hypothetical protein